MVSREIYSVSSLVGELRNLLETSYRSVWIEGEISGLARPGSGHMYFSLKEGNALIRCAFFKNRQNRSVTAEEGMQVLVRGQISVYPSRGDMQLIVTDLEPSGEGALRRAFELLKKQLQQEGLFDAAHKQDLPLFPTSIGVITSASGAVLQDVRITLGRRYPLARLIIYPTLVQGPEAAAGVCEMLRMANLRAETDVLIVARGGGSLEDLQAFNDESVARAIFASDLPVISAVGHETDFTIADMVADHRAPTPTAAAEIAAPDIRSVVNANLQIRQQLLTTIKRQLDQLRQQTDYMNARLIHPARRLEQIRHRLDSAISDIHSLARRSLASTSHLLNRQQDRIQFNSPGRKLDNARLLTGQYRQRLSRQTSFEITRSKLNLQRITNVIEIMSPRHTLERGYAILQDSANKVVTSAEQVKADQTLQATVADGTFDVTVAVKPGP